VNEKLDHCEKWVSTINQGGVMNVPTVPIRWVDEIPKPLRNRLYGGKWAWLRELVSQMTVGGKVLRLRFPNEKEMRRGQSAFKMRHMSRLLHDGVMIITRSEPVDSRQGEYFLYAQLISKD
jgi:hypothetical protein